MIQVNVVLKRFGPGELLASVITSESVSRIHLGALFTKCELGGIAEALLRSGTRFKGACLYPERMATLIYARTMKPARTLR